MKREYLDRLFTRQANANYDSPIPLEDVIAFASGEIIPDLLPNVTVRISGTYDRDDDPPTDCQVEPCYECGACSACHLFHFYTGRGCTNATCPVLQDGSAT